MGLKKGKTNNPAGRPVGTPNVLTREMRLILKNIVAEELATIRETLAKMEPDKRMEVILKLLPYVLPKVEPVIMEKGEPLASDWSVI